jgi:hypothetical protein
MLRVLRQLRSKDGEGVSPPRLYFLGCRAGPHRAALSLALRLRQIEFGEFGSGSIKNTTMGSIRVPSHLCATLPLYLFAWIRLFNRRSERKIMSHPPFIIVKIPSLYCTVNYTIPYGGFIKGILRGVRCTKSLRVLFLHRRPPSWTTLVLYSRAVL